MKISNEGVNEGQYFLPLQSAVFPIKEKKILHSNISSWNTSIMNRFRKYKMAAQIFLSATMQRYGVYGIDTQ